MESSSQSPLASEPIQPNVSLPSNPPPKKGILMPLLIIFGIVLLISAPTVYWLLSQTPEQTPQEVSITALPTPIPFFLELDNPKAETTSVDGQVLVSGKTFANVAIVIYTESDEVITESDEQGFFEETVLLDDTGGLLTITAYADDGDEISKTFSISESSDKTLNVMGMVMASSELLVKNDVSNSKSNSPKPINAQMVKEKAEVGNTEKEQKVKAFIQTKTISSMKKPEKLNAKELKALLADDSTASATSASGIRSKKKLETQEATPGAKLNRHALSGVITATSENMVTVSHPIQRERSFEIYFNSSTTITIKGSESASSSALEVGMRVTAVGEPVSNGVLAKRVHAIPGKASGVFKKNPVATESATATDSATASPSATPTTSVSAAPTPSSTPTTAISPSPSPTLTPNPAE